MITKLQKFLVKHKEIVLLIASLLLFRIPQLCALEYGIDDGIYAAVAHEMAQGKILYVTTWDHKPPFILLLYLITGYLCQFHLLFLWLRIVSFIMCIATIILFQKVLSFFKFDHTLRTILLYVFGFFLAAPLFGTYEVNAEIFMLFFTLLLLLFLFEKKPSYYIGICLFVLFTVKMQGFIEGIGIMMLYEVFVSQFKESFFRIARSIGSFLLVIGVSCVVLFYTRTFQATFDALIVQNNNYVDQVNPIVHVFGILLPVRIILLAGTAGIILYMITARVRQKMNPLQFLSSVMFIIEIFCITYGIRVSDHYLQQLIPGFVLLLGTTLDERRELSSATSVFQKIMPITVILIIFVTTIVLVMQEKLPQITFKARFEQMTFGSQIYHNNIIRFTSWVDEKYTNKSIFLCTYYSWYFVYPKEKFTNTYVFPTHMWFTSNSLALSVKNAREADIVIIDTKDPKCQLFRNEIAPFTKLIGTKNEFVVFESW